MASRALSPSAGPLGSCAGLMPVPIWHEAPSPALKAVVEQVPFASPIAMVVRRNGSGWPVDRRCLPLGTPTAGESSRPAHGHGSAGDDAYLGVSTRNAEHFSFDARVVEGQRTFEGSLFILDPATPGARSPGSRQEDSSTGCTPGAVSDPEATNALVGRQVRLVAHCRSARDRQAAVRITRRRQRAVPDVCGRRSGRMIGKRNSCRFRLSMVSLLASGCAAAGAQPPLRLAASATPAHSAPSACPASSLSRELSAARARLKRSSAG